MKKVVSGLVLMSFLVGCANVYTPSQTTYEGAAVGATTGALAGAILSKDNRWKGGVIGGVIGAIAGATITEIAKRGAQEVAQSKRPVRYESEDGRTVYEAKPLGYNGKNGCYKVLERVYEDGRVVKEQVKEVCDIN